ncbi:hypothetical protein OG203_38555 [Nocardia sp. NBC_01499]
MRVAAPSCPVGVRSDEGLGGAQLRRAWHIASWSEGLAAAAAAAFGSAGVLVGGRVTEEDAYTYGKFARIALGTNDVDFRARVHSAEEADFLAAHIAGQGMTVNYRTRPRRGVRSTTAHDTVVGSATAPYSPEDERGRGGEGGRECRMSTG